jgi:hypothetical protein
LTVRGMKNQLDKWHGIQETTSLFRYFDAALADPDYGVRRYVRGRRNPPLLPLNYSACISSSSVCNAQVYTETLLGGVLGAGSKNALNYPAF